MLLFILGRVDQVPLEINVQPGLDYLVKPIMDSNFKTSLDRSLNPFIRDTHFPSYERRPLKQTKKRNPQCASMFKGKQMRSAGFFIVALLCNFSSCILHCVQILHLLPVSSRDHVRKHSKVLHHIPILHRSPLKIFKFKAGVVEEVGPALFGGVTT